MDTTILRSLVEIQSEPGRGASPWLPSAPEKALPRTHLTASQRSPSIELQSFTPARRCESGPLPGPGPEPSLRDEPPAGPEADLEQSRPASPVPSADGVEALQSLWDPYKNRFRLLAACMMNFGNGLNDSAPGALIPYMESHYDIGYAVVSLIFVGNALGFVLAALFLDPLRARLGTARTLLLGQASIAAGYIPVVCTAPFPVVVMCFFAVGFGMSINIAVGNVFCGGLRRGTAALGAMHGFYGIGGTVGPLAATAMVAVAGEVWSRYYLLTLALAVANAGAAAWAFWDHEREPASSSARRLPVRRPPGDGGVDAEGHPQILDMFSALKLRIVLLGALFIFAYQGAEVSISGWVISFLIAFRGGDPASVGYVTAGFWAGITVGRFLLSGPAHRVGEKGFVYAAVAGAAVFELLVWWVPHVVGDAVAVAVVGLLLGPVYPCAAAVFMRGMSRREKVSGMGVISAFGSSGGAVAPFTTGILAQAAGTFVLHPIAIGLFAMMMVCWYGLPAVRKRSE